MTEVLYESGWTRVSRTLLPGFGPVVRKELRGPDAQRRVRHESGILARLTGVPGVVQHVPTDTEPRAILLEDVGGRSLAQLLSAGAVPPADLIGLAEQLADALAHLHRHGVIHKDINPGNVVVYGSPLRPVLIDFDLATTFALERPGFTHHTDVAGTLAYLAPEQTGRTGWPVDQRADLYAFGATLYEMATGSPPFGDGDALRLTHDHLTRIPVPPVEINPDVPVMLSQIICRLLEKEPDRRYQTAEGVQHDLRRLARADGAHHVVAFPLGECDFPWRLAPPSRLVGRAAEIETLDTALSGAVAGDGQVLLVSGAPGVGKTALIDELRPMVAEAGGWFVTGKFDQYRRDPGSDAVRQALRGLGRLLLAEPEGDLAAVRARLREALGGNVGLVAAVLPEFATLLDVAPQAQDDDPLRALVRLQQSALVILRELATPDRPVVVVVDDLQWAGATPLSLLDAVATGEPLPGVLLVGAYRESEVDAAHPLTPMLERWQGLPAAPPHVRLGNLPPAELGALLADTMRLPPPEAARLAAAIGAHTHGNPYDTVEFVNTLRREDVLVPAEGGWSWDEATVRQHLGVGDVVALLAQRVAALPAPTRDLLVAMACLGGEVELDLLGAATGPGPRSAPVDAADIEATLTPALEDGLLVMDRGTGLVHFRHDRVQQAVYNSLGPADRRSRHLAVARRLAPVPGFGVVAAEQYLTAVEDVREPAERAAVVPLFREAARHARLLANYALMERFLSAAGALLDGAEAPHERDAADQAARLRVELDIELHTALLGLGRFDDLDRVYARIERDCADPVLAAEAAYVQVISLTNRGGFADAVALGLAMLAALGHPVPDDEMLFPEIAQGIAALRSWVATGGVDDDVRRGANRDPRVTAIARIINRTIPAAFFCGAPVMAWLMTSAARMWAEGGPAAALVGPMAHAAFVTIPVGGDYRTGHAVVRRALDVAEALGWATEAGQARMLYALSAGPWLSPLEECMQEAAHARTALLHGGDLANAAFTYFASVCEVLDCAATLDDCQAEIEAALAFAVRTGNLHGAAGSVTYRQAVRALRGETDGPGELSDASFDAEAHRVAIAANPMATGMLHLMRALTAAVFGDLPALAAHAPAAAGLLPTFETTNASLLARLLHALALAWQAADPDAENRDEALAQLDRYRQWMAERAADAPANVEHLRAWLDAERALLGGDFEAAMLAFDTAQHAAESKQRPWHRALIGERRARFMLARGMEYAGRRALREAYRQYQAWGAAGKVAHLEAEHPFLAAAPAGSAEPGRRTIDARTSSTVSGQLIDLLAVLRASQALSSETGLPRLQERVAEVLCSLTGATQARLLLRDPDTGAWFLPESQESGAVALTVPGAAQQVPLSAIRYVERTREPLLVDDAAHDDRFAHDPYLSGLPECALLVVPILKHGTLAAMLLLENRLSRAAFGTNRLDTVLLIAGQLAVSLDNAMLYRDLERKVAERTQALQAANEQLELLAITDPLTGLANRRRLTDILDAEWRRSIRPGTPIAVAMIDVDQFKLYNDRYGHPAGDECLCKVATAIRLTIRETDLVARYGGEEFAVVLPSTDERDAATIAERVRAAVAGLALPHASVATEIVTVSVGVAATVPNRTGTPEQLIKFADSQLYEAKRTGRNRVVLGVPS